LDRFSRVKKKYNLTRVNYITVNMKDYLQPFDFEKCPKSRLPQGLYDLFQEMSNVTMYQRAISQFGIDTDVLPFSGVNKQSLVEARQLLLEISECIKEDIEISKEGIKADFDKLTAVKEKISELSSRFYELIPLARFKDQIAPPIGNQHAIKQQFDLLESLTNIEFASKVLLGALLRQKEMNPIDYVYHAMNIMIEALDKESPEYEVIRTYIDNTRNVEYNYNRDQYEIANIFKVQRKGEAEMIQAFKEVPNHYLLFHGSMMFNFIGILSQGLKIAPPEAPATGYMFGKGVYFADMFDKSFAYAARGYGQQESFLMMMCEVVLGKQKELLQAEYIEKLEHPYHSVKGCGRRGPGYKHTITLPNGVKIPYGKVIDYCEGNPEK
jgi:Poly(ADP-ribose) polymerase catalytic domain/Poly(ADP-ribose) polymerase, regulatory domain